MARPCPADTCRPPSASCGVDAGPMSWTAVSTWKPPNRTTDSSPSYRKAPKGCNSNSSSSSLSLLLLFFFYDSKYYYCQFTKFILKWKVHVQLLNFNVEGARTATSFEH